MAPRGAKYTLRSPRQRFIETFAAPLSEAEEEAFLWLLFSLVGTELEFCLNTRRTSGANEVVNLEELEAALSQKYEWASERIAATPVQSRYPNRLMEEYRALVKKALNHTMTEEEGVRFQAIREQINAMDHQRSRPDTWDIQAQKLRAELAQIRAEVDALPDARRNRR